METYESKNKRIRLALMGGTFDPIHFGHLVAAEAVRVEFNLDKVVFIPTGNPPHKKGRAITDAELRYQLTAAAVASNPYFEVSRMEIDRKGMSYTIDTVSEILEQYGRDSEIFFITGADALLDMLNWYKVGELFSLCKFVAATRPGYKNSDLENQIEQIRRQYSGEVLMIEIPSLAISSTDIRARVQKGKPIKYLLPEGVEEIIIKSGIYR